MGKNENTRNEWEIEQDRFEAMNNESPEAAMRLIDDFLYQASSGTVENVHSEVLGFIRFSLSRWKKTGFSNDNASSSFGLVRGRGNYSDFSKDEEYIRSVVKHIVQGKVSKSLSGVATFIESQGGAKKDATQRKMRHAVARCEEDLGIEIEGRNCIEKALVLIDASKVNPGK